MNNRVEATGSSTGACSLQLLMLSEHVLDPAIAALLPINALRNAALTAARTSLIALVDVDLLLSQTLAQELLDPTRCVIQCGAARCIVCTAHPYVTHTVWTLATHAGILHQPCLLSTLRCRLLHVNL